MDSILIDEARTPLIISGPAETSGELYLAADQLIGQMREEDYEKDEKARSVSLTEQGVTHAEELLSRPVCWRQAAHFMMWSMWLCCII